jgi:hypothetical protein
MEKRKARLTKRRQRQLLQLDNPPNPLQLLHSNENKVITYNWEDAVLQLNVRYLAFCFIVLYTASIIWVNYLLIRRVTIN